MMKLLRLGFLIVATLATALGANAQINAGKPVLSVPPPAPKNDPAPSAMPGPAAGQTTAPTTVAPSGSSGGADGMAPPPAAADTSATYVIGPDDTISVNVWREPSLSGTLPVRPDGMISLALVGDLKAAGFTPMQLAQDISGRLKKYVNDPNVTVTVTGVNSKRIYMLGEIGHVGPLALTAGLTPLEAIATAGGLSGFANGKHIYILRTVNGRQTKIPFDYRKAIKTGDQQGVTLMPDDKIVVP